MLPVQSSGIHEAIIVFNLLPATYVDPSWIEAPQPWRDRLVQLRSPGARSVLSNWLLTQHGLSECYDFDFSSIEKTLFLQGRRELQMLAAAIGVLRHRDALRRMITGGTLARLGEELGAASLHRWLVELPSPDFLPSPETSIDRCAERLLPQFIASGAPCLLGLLKPAWHAVTARARFKFPRELAVLPSVVLNGAAHAASLSYLKTHLLNEGDLCP